MKIRHTKSTFRLQLILLFILLPSFSAYGLTVPALQGRVVDTVGMLSPTTIQLLESTLATFEAQDSTQIVVLTINSLEGENLEEFSLKVAETWQIGRKGSDNGALLLISKNDRKLRIETGYGLEGSLTDLIAGRIIRDIITPRFRDGDFDQGVINGVSAMIGSVRGEFNNSSRPSEGQGGTGDFSGLLFFLLFAFLNLGRIFNKHKWLTGGIGAILAPLLGFVFFGVGGLTLLLLIPAGLVIGFLLSSISFASPSGRSTGGYSSGGFGGGGFGGGGFSGGGGGFGGGGSSGGW